jgi:hypothetical protein
VISDFPLKISILGVISRVAHSRAKESSGELSKLDCIVVTLDVKSGDRGLSIEAGLRSRQEEFCWNMIGSQYFVRMMFNSGTVVEDPLHSGEWLVIGIIVTK